LIRDYLRHVGGDPSAYKGTVPPHLASQWFFPVASRTLAGLDYPLFRMVNGGCRLELDGPLPADVPLRVSARLEAIDDDGRRALLRQRIATGTDEHPELVVAHVTTVVPLATGGAAKKKEKKEPARVPDVAREIAYWRIPANAGLAFAALTGDFNPVHWLAPYARLSGFRSTILHGFATLARAVEGLHRGLFSGDVRRLAWIEARFTRPLVLPAKVGLYVKGERLFVGDGCCGPAYLVATFSTTTKES
jgi:acyl dehydratase